MIFAPSPQILLHKNKPNFKLYYPDIYDEEDFLIALKKSAIITSDLLIDRCILTSRYSEFARYYPHYNSVLALIISLLSPNSDLNTHSLFNKTYLIVYVAMFALQCNDIETGLYFLKKASQEGNKAAMILYAKLILTHEKYQKDNYYCRSALQYLLNSLRYGSSEAYSLLGLYYETIDPKLITSLHMYSLHFEQTRSLSTALRITHELDILKQIRLSRKWMTYTIINCDPTHIQDMILHFANSKAKTNSPKIYVVWEKIISNLRTQSRIRSQIDQKQVYQSTIKKFQGNFDFHKDFYKLQRVITKQLPTFCHPQPLVYHSSIENKNVVLDNKIEYNPNIQEGYFPLRNKNSYILKIFELTTSNYHKRNLKLADCYLYNCPFVSDSKEFTNNAIFQCRMKSKNPEWLTSCGFIYLILGDMDKGFPLFLNASKLGNLCATMMCGFLLFHFKHHDEKLKKDSVIFFLKCAADPIALIHLFFIMNDESFLERACSILGVQSKMMAIIWLLNLLVDGVKMPILSNMMYVKMICLKAIDMGLNYIEDTSELYDFYYKHFQ